MTTRGDYIRKIKERRQRRDEQNTILRQHGYVWRKEYADMDEYEEDNPTEWNLYSPDGRLVDVAEALDEIKRGMDVVLAERQAAKEAADKRKAERAAAADAAEAELKQALDDVKALGHEVEPFDYTTFHIVCDQRSYETLTMIDTIYRGQINGVDCGVIYSYTGGHDYNESTTFWCADPDSAGLTKMQRDGLSQTFADFFGG